MKLSETLWAAARAASTTPQHQLMFECAREAEKLERGLDGDVREAHVKFGTDAPTEPVAVITGDSIESTRGLLCEEFVELMAAIDERNMAHIAAECVDLIYAAVGTLVSLGLPLMPFWRAIHKANMDKEPNPDGGKWLKPPGWRPANPAKILYNLHKDNS